MSEEQPEFIPRKKNLLDSFGESARAHYISNDEVYTQLIEHTHFKNPGIYHAALCMVKEIDGDYSQTVDLVYYLLLKLNETRQILSTCENNLKQGAHMVVSEKLNELIIVNTKE